jgi:hypothetical protein
VLKLKELEGQNKKPAEKPLEGGKATILKAYEEQTCVFGER